MYVQENTNMQNNRKQLWNNILLNEKVMSLSLTIEKHWSGSKQALDHIKMKHLSNSPLLRNKIFDMPTWLLKLKEM